MTTRTILLVAATLFAGAVAHADPSPATRPAHADRAEDPAGAGAAHAAHEAFEHHMEEANDAFKALRDATFDAGHRLENLEHVEQLQSALLGAKAVAENLPMTQRAREHYDALPVFHRDLRAGLIEALAASLELEGAINVGDADAARAAFKELVQAQRQGHRAFRKGPDNIGYPGGPPTTRPAAERQGH